MNYNLKKWPRTFALLLFVALGTKAHGQDNNDPITTTNADIAPQTFQVQIVLGANTSQIDGDTMGGFNKAGLLAGAAMRFPLSHRMALNMGMQYSMKGSRTSDEQFFRYGNEEIWRVNYVEVPLMVHYQLTNDFSAQLGGSANFLVNAKYGPIDPNATGPGAFQDVTQSFDFINGCYSVGFGYHALPPFEFNIRFSNSFHSAIEGPVRGSFGRYNGGFTHRYFSFMVRYNLVRPPAN